jgi:hypothetical protein
MQMKNYTRLIMILLGMLAVLLAICLEINSGKVYKGKRPSLDSYTKDFLKPLRNPEATEPFKEKLYNQIFKQSSLSKSEP